MFTHESETVGPIRPIIVRCQHNMYLLGKRKDEEEDEAEEKEEEQEEEEQKEKDEERGGRERRGRSNDVHSCTAKSSQICSE